VRRLAVVGALTMAMLPTTTAAWAAPADRVDPTFGNDGSTIFENETNANAEPIVSNVDTMDRTYVLTVSNASAHLRRLTLISACREHGSSGASDGGFPTGFVMSPETLTVSGDAYYVAGAFLGAPVAMLKVLASGSVDPSFGIDGIAPGPDLACGIGSHVVFVRPTAISVVGSGACPASSMEVFRFTAAGAVDPSFNGDGHLTITAIGSRGIVRGGRFAAMQSSGGIELVTTIGPGPAPG
jgi:hypothetical protein